MRSTMIFQSTRPMRGGTSSPPMLPPPPRGFQSTRPMRGGTPKYRQPWDCNLFQSTRPVRGGTAILLSGDILQQDFNPPAPCGAGRGYNEIKLIKQNFNPPAPCGAGRSGHGRWSCRDEISIHPPRAGRDHRSRAYHKIAQISIHPPRAGRDRLRCCTPWPTSWISIHPPRAGRDPPGPCGAHGWAQNISIHPPRAGRDEFSS